jgi:hypothetical protein
MIKTGVFVDGKEIENAAIRNVCTCDFCKKTEAEVRIKGDVKIDFGTSMILGHICEECTAKFFNRVY